MNRSKPEENNPGFVDDEKAEKKAKRKKILVLIINSFAFSLILAFFALIWQQSYDLLAFCNAFYFSGFILFFIGWMILMTNMNILSPVIYGLKTFFLMFAAKKPKTDYFEYVEDRKENPIPKHLVVTPFIACLPNFLVAIVLHILL